VYVGYLTAVPFPDGVAKVSHVAADGTVTDVWTGLTTVTDVAVSPDGTLYAVEMSTGNLEEPPFLVPGSGRIVRQTGPASAEDVATGLMFPITIRFGPDGALYVALPAMGAASGGGVIARIDGMGTPAAMADMPTCTPVGGTIPAA
jgi:sugar lactone lactonase YvrE